MNNKIRVYADGFSAAIGWGEKPSRHDFNGQLLQIGPSGGHHRGLKDMHIVPGSWSRISRLWRGLKDGGRYG